MVVLVEVSRKAYLASIVPVIVNAILGEHQIIVDIVAFVNKGDFPRSRLAEKQRGKILAGWVTRKMRTVAQFNIRDGDESGLLNDAQVEAHRASVGSFRSSGIPGASSLRNMEHAPQILEQEEFDHQINRMSELPPPAEMPAKSSRPAGALPPIDTRAAAPGGQGYDQPANTPQIRLPSVDGRETEMTSPVEGQGVEDDDWSRDAIMHFNLAGQS